MSKQSRKSLSEFITETELKLTGIIQEAEKKLENINTEFATISESKNTSQTELGAIQQVKTDANATLTELKQYQEKFVELRTQLDDEEDGLSANFEWAKTKAEEVSQIKGTSEEKLKLIEKLQKQAEDLQSKIAEYEKLTTGYKERIQETYNFMNGQGLAHSFYERKKEVDDSMKFWKWVLILSTVLLAGLIAWIFIKPPDFLNGITDIENWLDLGSYFAFRLFLFSPLIFAIWYSATQYSRERNDVAQYAFKGGVAKALENYTDLLTDKFQDKKGENGVRDEILKFTISCMRDIYENFHNHKVSTKKQENWDLEISKKEIEKFHNNIVKPVANVAKDIKNSVTS